MQKIETFYIKTYGCQMNELDSELMVGLLEKRGLKLTQDEATADVLIFNTCSVRDLAERKVMGKLGQIGLTSQRNAIIGVTGCMAMAKKENLLKKFPFLDFVLGTNNVQEIVQVLDKVIASKQPIALTEEKLLDDLDYSEAKRGSKIKAFVSIIRGCNKFCTYCIVPYLRGREVSKPPKKIIEECSSLVAKGYKEITLLGQNVDSYGKDAPEWKYLFHDLLYDLDKIKGLERIRFLTSHPLDITKELILAVRDLPSVCEFIHFPMQSGSNRILRKMHRAYTIEQYGEKVQMIKETIPQVALGTDIIVGFPTETEEDFWETYQKMEAIQFAVAYIFAYSPRKGTPASRWEDDLSPEVKQERLQKLLELHKNSTQNKLASLVGTSQEVLVDRENKRHSQRMMRGRTRTWEKVIFPSDKDLVGTLQQVQINGYKSETLLGTLKTR